MGPDWPADHYHERVRHGEQRRAELLPDLDVSAGHAVLGWWHDEYHAGRLGQCFGDGHGDGLSNDVVPANTIAASILPRVRGLCAWATRYPVARAGAWTEAGDCGERERLIYV